MVTDILTDRASEMALDCASGRTSLRAATARSSFELAEMSEIPSMAIQSGTYDDGLGEAARRIECRTIAYRSGFVEITNVHDGCVNLEVWQIDPEKVPPRVDIRSEDFPEEAVTDNIEIEVSLAEARLLIELLECAIRREESKKGSA